MRYPARELEGRHRAAELVGFGGRKSRANDRDLHRLFLEERHAERLLEHRSEEHTSELQSLMRISYAVFCLKKKTEYAQHIISNPMTSMQTAYTPGTKRGQHN